MEDSAKEFKDLGQTYDFEQKLKHKNNPNMLKTNSEDYLVIDTDDVLSEKRFLKSTGINKELGEMFRNKYEILPNLADDFDLIYPPWYSERVNIEKIIIEEGVTTIGNSAFYKSGITSLHICKSVSESENPIPRRSFLQRGTSTTIRECFSRECWRLTE